ncbi:hypothetical protein CIT292_10987 [Citrobacter youngae ATCC 29220]|uniref:Uncharacterized protein n=1 Tax=Citrobacter youngae ATCC 29220 TaxID=500640 RepID=D4BJZ3_9ENTR|nr:hypothetical protein CIT292_10987 [Citrobacter youngae ATCC 29220]
MGALFTKKTNKNNEKHRVNSGFDSESGTTFLFLCFSGCLYKSLDSDS